MRRQTFFMSIALMTFLLLSSCSKNENKADSTATKTEQNTNTDCAQISLENNPATTPQGLADIYAKASKDGDAEIIISMMCGSESFSEAMKTSMKNSLENDFRRNKERGEIRSYEIQDVQFQGNDSNIVSVYVNYYYGNGTTTLYEIPLIKVDSTWMLSIQ